MIHRYALNGFYIVLDIASGGVHLMDKHSYELAGALKPPLTKEISETLRGQFPNWDLEDLQERYGELYALYQNGSLFSEDHYRPIAEKMALSPIKSVCLNVAHDCNLRCQYCFASTGDFGKGRKLMSASTGKQAIDFLLTHSGDRHNLELDFFGGEPLMNFDVVKEVVSYARSKEEEYGKKFRFTITTNGILLDDDKIAFINREMHNVVLSLDGRKEVNDYMRPRADGSGSFDSIIGKFQKLVATRGDKDYYLRGTFTKHNLDFSKDVLAMHDLGFAQLSVEPVVAEETCDYALNEQDFPKISAEYDALSLEIIRLKKAGVPINFFHFMIDLDQGPCAIKRLRGCSCGNEYVAITPDGDIYPCHQFIGKDEWKLGSLNEGLTEPKKREGFLHTTVFDKPACVDCWAKYYCSGGCNANHLDYAGDMKKPYTLSCELEKKRLECAIMIQAALKNEENCDD